MNSLLYVSSRSTKPDAPPCDVIDIVMKARVRNAELNLTGALVATPHHFAQILEGPAVAIDQMMERIARDPRHADLRVAPTQRNPRREFRRWSLAYHGESSYVSGLVAAVLTASDGDLASQAQDIRSLIALLA